MDGLDQAGEDHGDRAVQRDGHAPRAVLADTASIAAMELTDGTVIAAIPGAMDAGLGTALFWASPAFSLIVAFVATVPLNRWLIGRGKGPRPPVPH